MKQLLWPACLLTVVLAGCGGSTRRPSESLQWGAASAQPAAEEAGTPLALRTWTLTAPVRVVGGRCTSYEYAAAATATFDGRSDGSGGAAADINPDARGIGELDVNGSLGDAVTVRVSATCDQGRDRGRVVRGRHAYSFPAMSCEGGPIRVLTLTGRATYRDDSYSGRPHPLAAGDLLHTGPGNTLATTVELRGGTATIGAPECDGFQVTLSPGATVVGGYDAYGRGRDFVAAGLTITGDGHAGGVELWRTADSSRVVRALPTRGAVTVHVLRHGNRAAVRDDAGIVAIRGLAQPLLLRANEETHLACTARGCAATRPTLVEPGELFRIAARRPPPPRLARTLPGPARPPAFLLAPAYAETHTQSIPASAGQPAELVVDWQRDHRAAAGSRATVITQIGTIIWVRVGRTWRRLFDYRPNLRSIDIRSISTSVADVTGDGHPDAIVSANSGGSGGCRDFHVVAEVRGLLRTVFTRHDVCEAAEVSARRGQLLYSVIIGPCPQQLAGAHCYGGVESDTLHWTGNGFRRIGAQVRCVEPDLDPKLGCRRAR